MSMYLKFFALVTVMGVIAAFGCKKATTPAGGEQAVEKPAPAVEEKVPAVPQPEPENVAPDEESSE